MAKRSKINYGRSNRIPVGAFESRKIKERVTIFLDEDVLNVFRKWAAEAPGGKYQGLINQVLRRFVFGPQDSEFEQRLKAITSGITSKS